MKTKHAINMMIFRLFLLPALLCLAGCEVDNTSGTEETTADIQAEVSSTQAQEPTNEPESTGTGEAPPADTPPATTTPTSGSAFLWQPGSDSVRIVIPAKYAHWKMHVFSRRKHVILYGPDTRGGNRSQDIEYVLPGNGEAWRRKSLEAGDDGTLLVFINTRDVPAGGQLKNAGWRIMNPASSVSGDGDRIQPGENK